MTIHWGDTGKAVVGTLKNISIAYQPMQENLLETPTTLPITEPITPQVSYTVREQDFPVFSNGKPLSFKCFGWLIGAGKNTDTVARTISYRVKKNGATVGGTGTYSSAPAGQYWNITFAGSSSYGLDSLSVGDLFEIYFWDASGTGMLNFDYGGLAIGIGKIHLSNNLITDLVTTIPTTFTSQTGRPTLGNPNANTILNPYVRNGNGGFNAQIISGTNINHGSICPPSDSITNGTIKSSYGDNFTSVYTNSHATFRPNVYWSYMPTNIKFRELSITKR